MTRQVVTTTRAVTVLHQVYAKVLAGREESARNRIEQTLQGSSG